MTPTKNSQGDRDAARATPLQNCVTPFGDVVAIPRRGLLTGNRGIIHDPTTRTLGERRWAGKAWLACLCAFEGRRRIPMIGRSWTELFFLDEAVALAAGHRPCFFCRRPAAEAFRAAWAKALDILPPSAPEMDAVLHRERLQHGRKRLHVLTVPVSDLPDGAVVAAGGAAHAVVGGRLFRWTEDGYGAIRGLPVVDGLVTPPSIVAALAAGYRPMLHPALGGST